MDFGKDSYGYHTMLSHNYENYRGHPTLLTSTRIRNKIMEMYCDDEEDLDEDEDDQEEECDCPDCVDEDDEYDDEDDLEEEEDTCPDCGQLSCNGAYGEECEDLEEEDSSHEVCATCDDYTCPGANGGSCQHLHAWREGRRASMNKKSVNSNPYLSGTKGPAFLGSRWYDGYCNQNKPS